MTHERLIGQTIGHYRVEAKLGEGGMGVVYRARDAHLDRSVAIKVLGPTSVGDPTRKQRFVLEAKAASALNHPNILHVYDVNTASVDAQPIDFIAMELVEGRTLDELIGRKGLPVREVLKYAIQIAAGLSAAHGNGIVHRDLKPGNIMISGAASGHPGLVKILDFGLAKLREVEAAGSFGPTRTASPQTEQGTILGTVAYMSPEQTEGRAVDARADIFAFGSVLYEMITGRPAFQGSTSVSTLAAILHQEPKPVTQLVHDSPRDLEKIVNRCLRKDPERRIQHIDDVKVALEEVQEDLDSAKRGDAGMPSRGRGWRAPLALAGVALVAAAAGALSAALWIPAPQLYRFAPLAAEAAEESYPAWSPDSRTIAYAKEVAGVRQVFVRSLDSTTATQITQSSAGCSTAFWSPDGGRIYYVAGGNLWSVGAAGGAARVELQGPVAGAHMSRDGKALAFIRGPGGRSTLWIAAPVQSNAEQYRTPPFPQVFARSRTLQFSPDGTKLAVLMERDVEAGELWIVPFPSGTPRRILSLQPMGTTVGTVDHRVSWTADSRHLILDGPLPAAAGNHLHLVDTDRSTIRSITPGTGEEWTPAVSPAGDTIAFAAGGVDFDLVQISLDGGDIRPLLASARSESAPAWSRSGGQIAYVTNAAGASEIWLRNMQEGFARPIVSAASARSPWRALERPSFSPDGQRIVYGVVGLGSHALVIAPSTGGQPVGLDRDSPDHHGASWSPDGNWLAYTRLVKVGENWELVKAPLSGGPPVRLAPAGDGGSETAWSPTGEWIAQVRNRTIHLVSADGATEKPLNLAVVPAGGRPGTFGFSTDGSLLYVIRANDQQWQLLAVEVPSGGIRSTTKLNLPISASVVGFSLHPDGKSIATSVGTNKYDLWLLEGFQPRAPWWRRLVS